MKKIFNTSIFYLIIGLLGGVFFREFTKFNDFTGITVLKNIHIHLLILGFFLFLILVLFEKQFNITGNKLFNKFYIIYNIGLLLTSIMFLIKGIFQVLGTSYNVHMIAGISGLGHIILAIGFILLMVILKKEISIENK